MAARLAVHSALHCLTVFCFADALVGEGCRAGAAACDGCCAVGAAFAAVPPRHSAMKSRFFFPLASMAARLAVHSALHCLAVFCCANAVAGKAKRPANAPQAANTHHFRLMFNLLLGRRLARARRYLRAPPPMPTVSSTHFLV